MSDETNGLILTRRENEAIYIGDDIVVKVLNIQRNMVSIAIKAPEHIDIVRKELLDHEGNQ